MTRKKGDFNPLKTADFEKLAYIHTNRTMSPTLFRNKFLLDKGIRRSIQLIHNYKRKGLLFQAHPMAFEESVIALTENGIRVLVENRVGLFKNRSRVKITHKEIPHHHRVTQMRIAIEQAFPGIFWISDFEMRSGVTRWDKKKFEKLRTVDEKDQFYKAWRPRQKNHYERTPDGYFELIRDDYWYPYVLEYENYPYSKEQVFKMLNGLEKDFPKAKKLIVSATAKNANELKDRIARFASLPEYRNKRKRPVDLSRWFYSTYQDVINLPFDQAFKAIPPVK